MFVIIKAPSFLQKPFGDSWVLWNVADNSTASAILNVLFASGFFFMMIATFCIDHFSLVGLSQAFRTDISAALGLSMSSKSSGATQPRNFVPSCLLTHLCLVAICTRGLYSLVAHPIMTGFFLGTHPLEAAPIIPCFHWSLV